jgi:small redox-active disulfide protein 2
MMLGDGLDKGRLSVVVELKVLGPGCARCNQLFEDTQEAIVVSGVQANLVKVENIQDIMQYGVMMTPALIIDGTVKCAGKVPAVAEIAAWLQEAAGGD